MAKYTQEQVIQWLELIRNGGTLFDGEVKLDEEGLAKSAIEYLKASMPALEGDDA